MSLWVFFAWLLYSPKPITHFSSTGDGISAKAFLYGDEGADGYMHIICEGGEDGPLDIGFVEGSIGIGSERICAIVVVCQRQAWN